MRFDLLRDFLVTILCWTWFTAGFLLFFSWRYLGCTLFARDRQQCFQRLNSLFFRIFFRIVKVTAPTHKWEIDTDVTAIRSAVIVCNHLSYLDPLLLISLFERHRTIVKTRFFSMPVFGRIIRKSGYFPSGGENRDMMLRQMETMEDFLKSGGNLFVFPEGTRNRDGRIVDLNTGALKIARLCRAPIYVLRITHTDRLFTPGRFLFQTGIENTITLEIIDRITPNYKQKQPTASALEMRVRQAFEAGQH